MRAIGCFVIKDIIAFAREEAAFGDGSGKPLA
jgi:hypothetical protein